MKTRHSPNSVQSHSRQILIGVSLAVSIVLAGTFALLRYLPMMIGVEMESNPVPVWTQVMVGGLFFVTFGSFVVGLYRELTTDEGVEEPSRVSSEDNGVKRLKSQYASGSIDEDEFRRRLTDADADAGWETGSVDGSISREGENRTGLPRDEEQGVEQILERRLAKGELTVDEYERRIEVLRE